MKHEYITQGGNATLERWNDGEEKSLEFIYDNGGAPYSVIYSHGNEVDTYYYILNQQGDVIRIVDTSGKTVTEYTYNGWGEILNVSNAKGSEIGTLNPIRYRGYYYDSELNMYYLQSRYYDPVMKRMIASDDESLTTGATLNNNNLFAYCDNNPIMRADGQGEFWHIVIAFAIGSGVEALTEHLAGEQLDCESIILSGFSCSIATAFGPISGAVEGTSIAAGFARYVIDVGVGVGSDMMAYSFSDESKTATKKDVVSKIGSSVFNNGLSAGISRAASSRVASLGKKAVKSLGKKAAKPLAKVAKKSSIISKVKTKFNRVKSKASALKTKVSNFCNKHKIDVKGHISAFSVNCAVKWKEIKRNFKRKWKRWMKRRWI